MPTVVQFRRGTTAQNDAFTGSVGEISYDTEVDTLRVHDGSTAGGFPLVNTTAVQSISSKTLTATTIGDGQLTSDATGTDVTTAGAVEVDSYTHNSAVTAIEYTVLASDAVATETQVSKYLLTYDTSAIAGSEYGVTFTGAGTLGTLSSNISAGDLKLYFTRAGSNTVTVKVFKTVIT